MHRLDGIGYEVEEYLLQLHPIACHRTKHSIQFSAHDNPVPLKDTLNKRKHLVDELIQIDGDVYQFLGFEHRAQALNHLSSMSTVANNLLKSFPRLTEIGRCPCQPAQPGTGICYDGAQGLIDFVRNRRGHGAHSAHVC